MTTARLVPGPVSGTVRAPASKSYTHRFLLAAHLSGVRTAVRRPLESDDTRRTADALASLGTRVRRGRSSWTVVPGGPPSPSRPRTIDCGESGTTLRLVSAVAALRAGRTRFVGEGRLPARPMEPLLRALRALGARTERSGEALALPMTIEGPIHGGAVHVSATTSSQFTSALLLALPTCREDSVVRLDGAPVSEPYVRATVAVLRRSGVRLTHRGNAYHIPGGQRYRPLRSEVPGDASSAAYLLAAAALTDGEVTVRGLEPRWPQADLAVLPLLRRQGARVYERGGVVRVGAGRRRPFRVELTAAPDLYPLAGVLAAVTPGRSEILGAAQVVAKESDRRAETIRLVRAIGATARLQRGGLVIEGTERPRALRIRGATDHRIVMSASVAALAASGGPSAISEASCVAKSFPSFFSVLGELGAEVSVR